MAPVMALDGATSFLHLKDVTNTCKRMRHSPIIGLISCCNGEAEDFKSVFVVNCRNRSVLVHGFLSNNSLL